MKINTDQSYLLGLLVGGGILHGESLQILLPYKQWGALSVNPERAGEISKDILQRLNPIWQNQYNMGVSYKIGTDWKIVSDNVSDKLKADLVGLGLPMEGELRSRASLERLIPFLITDEHKKNFITGLVDTIGSLAQSHRRFVADFQVVSFEFKGPNFDLVKGVIQILQAIKCPPDQVLWNHPNQHSGSCRYYKSWKKGFKVRVSLDDYILNGGFVFKSKKLSAKANLALQAKGRRTSQNKPIKIQGRVTIHKDEFSNWLPKEVRGGHFIHNLHFYKVLGLRVSENFKMESIIKNFEEFFCPFTCLTKGTSEIVKQIIANEDYLKRSKYRQVKVSIAEVLDIFDKDKTALLWGKEKGKDGFPISLVMQGIAFVIAASKNESIMGNRVLGSYFDLLTKYKTLSADIKIYVPNRGTCLMVESKGFAALIGYVNNQFNKSLIEKKDGSKIMLREPKFEECIALWD